MATQAQAQAAVAALQQQINDAADADSKVEAAVRAAVAAAQATNTVTGHVFTSVANIVPMAATPATPAPQPAVPAQPANARPALPVVRTQAPAVVQPVATQAPAQATAAVVVPPVVIQTPATPAATTPTLLTRLNPRGWSWMQWLFAILGAFVALIVFSNTRGWLPDLADVSNGTLNWLFRAGWVIAGTAVGFFGGGLLGARLDQRLAVRRAANNPPATPAPTP